ncbi:MAG TPA: sigma-70 family RNA polymerase sigma factor [Pseudomonadales bacterium]|jgi:RNA polymerase sigma-70 factor (ECF subfamily)|nr:sigma-70 family RNA polymerase sigma factor [Pseudomonadales bacterium]HMW14728.1 sigma-70 family RNA polymerase sigma factor [Pseudomonadales bacterium]HMW82879.1 sigma-70 family RNA polymerase sigma factor [Pseudomonadales bacterium]HMZ70688.1 sigma-70 family RNA polymerase sigma factor [Pseudomonadales bacterium]HMZ91690.1 sigma-70 family RNA polymerase sigma factor [Pseudomonadales bacterium]
MNDIPASTLPAPMPIEPADTSVKAALSHFFEQHETSAYLRARRVTRDSDTALELVQEAMTRLVSHYRDRPPAQWPALFQRILQNQLRDWQRQQYGPRAGWRFAAYDEQDEQNPTLPAASSLEPDRGMARGRFHAALAQAVASLAPQQQRTFMLRCWDGLNEQQTADRLGISIGSVKTHYFRALQQLRARLEAYRHE